MKINCIVIEDEPLALEKAKEFILKTPLLSLLTTFDNGIDAFTFLKSNKVELIFLDINLGEFSGVQLLETLNPVCQVIIITAYNEFALKGYELNVTDYLMKPYTFERYLKAVDKAYNNLSAKENKTTKDFFFVKTENRLEKVFLKEVLYIEGMRDYRKIHTTKKKIMTLQTFKDFEQEILPGIISRVHKSYMVSLDKIDFVEKDFLKIENVSIPISDTYKKDFMNLINSRKG